MPKRDCSYNGTNYSYTFQEWSDMIRSLLPTDKETKLMLARAPLWDYWSAGESPQDVAAKVIKVVL